jgi:hypothetical protein
MERYKHLSRGGLAYELITRRNPDGEREREPNLSAPGLTGVDIPARISEKNLNKEKQR